MTGPPPPSPDTTSSLHLLTGAFAVDALAGDERVEFERHLAMCPECSIEVAELTETVAGLSDAVAVAAPPRMQHSVLDRISRVRPLPPLVGRDLRQRRTAGRLAGPRRRIVGVLAAAAVVAAIGVGLTAWPSPDAPDSTSAAAAVLEAPDVLRSTVDFEHGATASVYHSDSLHQAVLVTDGLPPAPAGRVYALWLDQPASGLEPAGVLGDEAQQSVLLTGDAATADRAAITLEPVGGSDSPTTAPMAVFDFGQGA